MSGVYRLRGVAKVRKLVLGATASIALAMLGMPGPAVANHQSVSGDYVTPGIVSIDGVGSVGLSGSQGGVNRGGVPFGEVAFAPNQIKVTDSNGVGMYFSVCQDGGDGVCGQGTGDIQMSGCTTGGWQTLGSAFLGGRTTTVFIGYDEVCGNVPTAGTVMLRRNH